VSLVVGTAAVCAGRRMVVSEDGSTVWLIVRLSVPNSGRVDGLDERSLRSVDIVLSVEPARCLDGDTLRANVPSFLPETL